MTPPYASAESTDTFRTERSVEVDFDHLHRYIVIALGFCESPMSAFSLRNVLSPATVSSLDRHIKNLEFPGKSRQSVERNTMSFLNYYFNYYSKTVDYQYEGEASGYKLTEGGQAQCTKYLKTHVDGQFPLQELPIMVQQLAEPTTIIADEQTRNLSETQPPLNSVADSVGIIALAPVRAA